MSRRVLAAAALLSGAVASAAWAGLPERPLAAAPGDRASAPPIRTPAVTAATGATILQAERLRVARADGRVVRDATAGGRRALLLTGGGAARGTVRLAAASQVVVTARGTACAGASARLRVTVGRAIAFSGRLRSAHHWSASRGAATVTAGRHTVTVRLTNPRRARGCRRSALVDRLTFLPAAAGPPAGARWSPAPGTTWQWQLSGTLDLGVHADMYDIDLFDTSSDTVAALHRRGRHVVCYLDAGTSEPGRPDSGDYPDALLGAEVEGWPGERWLDVRRLDVLGPLIERRLDLCRAKGFDGVEPDNVDGYTNDSGFALDAADQLAFNRFVATAAHARGLSVGLKNDLEQAATLAPDFDWALSEQCFQYDECDRLAPFTRAGKAVFVAEYELDPATFCSRARAAGLSAMRKHLDLDAWRQAC